MREGQDGRDIERWGWETKAERGREGRIEAYEKRERRR